MGVPPSPTSADPSVKHPKTDRMNLVLSRPQSPQQTPCPHPNVLVESRFCLPKADYGRVPFHNPVSQRVLSHCRHFFNNTGPCNKVYVQ